MWCDVPVQVFGKLLRQIEPLAAFRLRNKKWFGIASSTFLVTVPLMKVSVASDALSEMAIGNLLLTILAAIVLHLVYLAFNTLMTTPLGLNVKERKAVIILTSQKTLPVAVTVISFLDDSWNLGIIVIPCILCHLCQLLIDGLFVNKWATMTEEGGTLGLGQVPTADLKAVAAEESA
jgi:sodium/bile acid cotransporter 7